MDEAPLYVHLVYVNSDETEGKGPFMLKCIFLKENHAVEWIEAQPDPWGSTDREWTESNDSRRFGHMYYTAVEVLTESMVLPGVRQRELAEGALAKLGREEIAALKAHFAEE